MSKNFLTSASRLRIAMRSLETELGLADLTSAELDALAAAVDLSSSKACFKAKDVVKHPLLSNVSRATQYRAVQALEDKGLIAASQDAFGEFMLVADSRISGQRVS